MEVSAANELDLESTDKFSGHNRVMTFADVALATLKAFYSIDHHQKIAEAE